MDNEGEINNSGAVRNMQGETWRKRKDNDRLVIFCLGTVINETLEQGMLISERRKSLGRKQKVLNLKKKKNK